MASSSSFLGCFSSHSVSSSQVVPAKTHKVSDLDARIASLQESIRLGPGRFYGGHENSASFARRLGQLDHVVDLFQKCSEETSTKEAQLALFADKLKPILRGLVTVSFELI
jgi:hypothetical protein